MSEPRQPNPIAAALYVNVAVLLAILVVLLTRQSSPSVLPAAFAQNQQPIAGGAGVFVMPAQLSSNTWGCYLLDVDTQTLCCYQYWPGDKVLRLVAARNFRHDRLLRDFNTDPAPQFVKDMLDKETQGLRGGGTGDENSRPGSPAVPPEQ